MGAGERPGNEEKILPASRAELPVWKLAVTTRARAEEPPTGSAI